MGSLLGKPDVKTLQYDSIKLPYELVNNILEYEGCIKYKQKMK